MIPMTSRRGLSSAQVNNGTHLPTIDMRAARVTYFAVCSVSMTMSSFSDLATACTTRLQQQHGPPNVSHMHILHPHHTPLLLTRLCLETQQAAGVHQ